LAGADRSALKNQTLLISALFTPNSASNFTSNTTPASKGSARTPLMRSWSTTLLPSTMRLTSSACSCGRLKRLAA